MAVSLQHPVVVVVSSRLGVSGQAGDLPEICFPTSHHHITDVRSQPCDTGGYIYEEKEFKYEM